MFALPEPGLRRPVLSGEDHFNLMPMVGGVRLTGGSELARIGAAPDWRPIELLAERARAFLPDLPAEPATRALGLRSSLPDSLPVLGESARHRGVYFAFGYQHLGMTLAAISGRIVADLVAGRDTGIALAPYRAERW
jgi:D-amino-acid dehydrogenase